MICLDTSVSLACAMTPVKIQLLSNLDAGYQRQKSCKVSEKLWSCLSMRQGSGRQQDVWRDNQVLLQATFQETLIGAVCSQSMPLRKHLSKKAIRSYSQTFLHVTDSATEQREHNRLCSRPQCFPSHFLIFFLHVFRLSTDHFPWHSLWRLNDFCCSDPVASHSRLIHAAHHWFLLCLSRDTKQNGIKEFKKPWCWCCSAPYALPWGHRESDFFVFNRDKDSGLLWATEASLTIYL